MTSKHPKTRFFHKGRHFDLDSSDDGDEGSSSRRSSSSSSDVGHSKGRSSRKRFKTEIFDPGVSNNAGFFETRAFKQRGWGKKQNLKKEASKKRKTSQKNGQKFPPIPPQGRRKHMTDSFPRKDLSI
jgi:hypothetical protein